MSKRSAKLLLAVVLIYFSTGVWVNIQNSLAAKEVRAIQEVLSEKVRAINVCQP